jgi:glycosyltransferase involved in cell wall biosynthesis
MAYIVSHPIQYQAPLLRLLSRQAWLDLRVLFLHQATAGEYYDPGFDRKISWDVPVLDGYAHETLEETKFGRGLWHSTLAARLVPENFEVVWIHGYSHPTLLRAVHLAHRRGIKVLLRGDSNPLIPTPNPVRSFAKKRLLKWLLPRCAAFLCIGKLNRAFYLRNGVSEDCLFDVPYAVDNAFFQQRAAEAKPHRATLRTSLSLTPNRPVILFAGKLQEHKGPMDLLQAYIRFSATRKREALPYLLFAGDGPERGKLERAAATCESIRFLGFQNQTELPGLFDLCDLFVLPSHKEPWGLVVNEVMNAAKPVVLSDVTGCAPDLVSDDNGWLFRAGDVTSLCNALSQAFQDPHRLTFMGQRSLLRINRYSFEQDADGVKQAALWSLRRQVSAELSFERAST